MSEFLLWGERGLVSAMFYDLAHADQRETWEGFLRDCIEVGPTADAPIKSVTTVIEPDFGNFGFGHPDALLRIDLESGLSRALIVEAKRTQFIKACCSPRTRGCHGYNSKLNGQLELNHCLALALSQWDPQKPTELSEDNWVLQTPYNSDRQGSVRSVKNASVLKHLVRRFSCIPFADFSHLVITTDQTNPFKGADCAQYLPELYTPDSSNENRWSSLDRRFAWISWWRIEQFFRTLITDGRLTDSRFMPSFEINRGNLHGRGHNRPKLARSMQVSVVNVRGQFPSLDVNPRAIQPTSPTPPINR